MSRCWLLKTINSVRTTIVMFLELEGYPVDAVASTREALERLSGNSYPIIMSDIYIDEQHRPRRAGGRQQKNPDCAVILMTGRGTMETVMAATQGGAFDYIAKPFELDQLLDAVKRAENAAAGDQEDEADIEDLPGTEMIGSSASMVEIYKTLSRVAPTDATVPDRGRDRNRQRTDGAHDPSQQPAGRRTVRRRRLRGDRPLAARKRVVRRPAGCLHRRRPRPRRRVRSRQPRHGFPG